MPPVLIVAHMWNTNGMATWCWEAAHSLFEAGEPVVLVCARDLALPGEPAMPVIRFDIPIQLTARQGLLARVRRECTRASARSSVLLPHLHRHLVQLGYMPRAYLLNCAGFQSPSVAVPQFVVGWAFPTSLRSYLRKVPIYAPRLLSVAGIRTTLDQIGWFRTDRRAYRESSAVLCVSTRLQASLICSGIGAAVVHPGSSIRPATRADVRTTPTTFAMAAVDLDDPRKNIGWMLAAMRDSDLGDGTLVLIGGASARIRRLAIETGLNVRMLGHLRRDEAIAVMAECDVFLFGSALDDWGYVLSEAMTQGLAVIAPDLSPFDEIVGDGGCVYRSGNAHAFRAALRTVAGPRRPEFQKRALQRACGRFSRAAFAQQILRAVDISGQKTALKDA